MGYSLCGLTIYPDFNPILLNAFCFLNWSQISLMFLDKLSIDSLKMSLKLQFFNLKKMNRFADLTNSEGFRKLGKVMNCDMGSYTITCMIHY